jgi:hypothetical protein
VTTESPTAAPMPTWARDVRLVECDHEHPEGEAACLGWNYATWFLNDYDGPTGMLVGVTRDSDEPAGLWLELKPSSSKTPSAVAAFRMAAALYEAGMALLEDERSRLAT